MMTAGTYDAAGDFAYYVGLPAKSGVGGGIVAVVPHVMGVCVWSPGLDDKGNSLVLETVSNAWSALRRSAR